MQSSLLAGSAAVSVAGALLSLDRTAAFQSMVSRPIVAAPVIGYMLGAPQAALVIGIVLELLFIGDLPVGRYIPVHETGLAVLATALSVAALKASGAGPTALNVIPVLPLAIMAAIPVSKLYHRADKLTRELNYKIFVSAARRLENGGEVNLVKENFKGIALFFLTGLAALFATIAPLMYLTDAVFPKIAVPWVLNAGSLGFLGLFLLGIASALSAVFSARSVIIYSASGIVTAVLWVAVKW